MESFIVNEKKKVTKLINNLYPFLNQVQIKMLYEKKDIKVNGKRIKENVEVNVGDKIEVFFDFEKHINAIAKVVFSDENVLIINKPQGIEVVSNNKDDYTLEKYLSKIYPYAKAVHRIDTNTKGLVIFALNESSYNELLNAFKNCLINKYYSAICHSQNNVQPQIFEEYLQTDKAKGVTKKATESTGKLSKLEILKVNKINNDLCVLDIKLYTGRTHQIRAQLAQHNIFVLGDGKYGDKTINRKYKKDKQELLANKIEFSFEEKSFLHYLNAKSIQI